MAGSKDLSNMKGFEGKERIITENWTPWQTNGGEACKNAALLEKTSSVEPVPIVL